MSFVDRLTCPYCRTLLNPGAMVCHACGAVRGGRPASLFLICIVFPLLAFVAGLTAFGVSGQAIGAGGFLIVFAGAWFGLSIWHGAERARMHWTLPSVGAVVREGVPEIVRDSAEDKVCPKCAERVKRAASVCRFCGFDFDAPKVIGDERAAGSVGVTSRVIDATPVAAAADVRENHTVMWTPRWVDEPLPLPPPPAPRKVSGPAVALLVVAGLAVGIALATRPSDPRKAAAEAIEAKAAYDRLPAVPAPAPGTAALDRAGIAEAQRLLAGLGYDVGMADGVAGARTRAAVKAFRAKAGIGGEDIDGTLLVALRRMALAPR